MDGSGPRLAGGAQPRSAGHPGSSSTVARACDPGGDAPESVRAAGRDPGAPSRMLADDEIEELDGIPVTSVSRTLFDLAGVLNKRQLERAINEAEVLRPDRSRSRCRICCDATRGGAGRRLCGRCWRGRPSRRHPQRARGARSSALLDAHGLPRPRLNADLGRARPLLRGRLPLAARSGSSSSSTGARSTAHGGHSRPTASATGSCSPRAGARCGSPGASSTTNRRRSPATCAPARSRAVV